MWHSRTIVPPSDGAFRNPVTLIIELKDEDKAKKDGPLYEKIRFEHKADAYANKHSQIWLHWQQLSLLLQLLRLLSSPRQPPPPPPILPSPEALAHNLQRPPPACRAPITQQLNDFMMCGSRTRRKQCFRSLKRGVLYINICFYMCFYFLKMHVYTNKFVCKM